MGGEVKNLLKEDQKIIKHIMKNGYKNISHKKDKSELDFATIKSEGIALFYKHKHVKLGKNGIRTYIGNSA